MASCLLRFEQMTEQPHFDDERTVLSARPVVPLGMIEAKVKHRRRWFLGGAFAIAMFLGAASALVSAYFKLRNEPEAEIQSLSVSSVSDEIPPPPTVEVLPQRPKPRAGNTDKTDHRIAPPRVSEDEALHQIRNTVLIDQWEERRARRVERRERRRAQHHDRDLSNIDEIFEGRRRP